MATLKLHSNGLISTRLTRSCTTPLFCERLRCSRTVNTFLGSLCSMLCYVAYVHPGNEKSLNRGRNTMSIRSLLVGLAGAVLILGAVGYAKAEHISIKLTSEALGLGTGDINKEKTVDPDRPGFVTSTTTGEGSVLQIQTDGLAGPGTMGNPLFVTITAETHLDVTQYLPTGAHDYHAGVIFISKEESDLPDGRREGLGVRAFTVSKNTLIREIDSGTGRAKIEGSKHVSGGTDNRDDFVNWKSDPNGAPHEDEQVNFEFDPLFNVSAQSIEVLLSEFASDEVFNLSIERTGKAPIVLADLGEDDESFFTNVSDNLWKLSFSGITALQPGDLVTSFTIGADVKADGKKDHFWITGLTIDAQPVPAPSTLIGLVSMGAMGLVIALRRKSRNGA